jgi:hypothetical protein
MKADIFTKAFTDRGKWLTRLIEIGHWTPGVSSLEHQAVVTPKDKSNLDKLAHELQEASAVDRPATGLLSLDDRLCKPKRTMIEFCCGKDSLLGRTEKFRSARGCKVVRITEEIDARSPLAMKLMLETINATPGHQLLLFSAMPCTGGSPWQYLNIKKPGVAAKVRKHWKLFKELWEVFVVVAEKVLKIGGEVVIEWPRGCRYWQWNFVISFLKRNGLCFTDIDGCSLGLTSVRDGGLIMKPWRLASGMTELSQEFQHSRCNRMHYHTPCAGVDTKLTENYTDSFAEKVHNAFNKCVVNKQSY